MPRKELGLDRVESIAFQNALGLRYRAFKYRGRLVEGFYNGDAVEEANVNDQDYSQASCCIDGSTFTD